ncbi:methyltransferase [Thioclava sp. SK-1]|uniref:class I SAM-dependent methyltransferase n=1 Tax=Thioclava sp. SK-1 TaxID=1889770 RepID=UPI0008243BB3|nr:SAM-dependent methyltransferase [Thioclava sp. SK-1]OCX62806.1 methyltransferase [Thioclava sp. SK-1]
MTELGQVIARTVATDGPMRLDQYMAQCLLHPDYGYYATRDPFGAGGDFTTAPEISQMYGEMLGLCLAQVWMDQGQPAAFVLAEPGPGRGTLMSDMLRVMRSVSGMTQAAQVHLIEASAHLRKVQRQTLGDQPITWHDSIDSLPADLPLFMVANEFFDALPIRQFQRVEGGWAERQIGLADGELVLGLAPAGAVSALQDRLADTAPGDVVELCPAAPQIVTQIARRIAAQGGGAIIVDYGDWRSLGDTFQALRDHQPVDPLAEPGLADLTAHVDFEQLAAAARDAGADVSAMTPQGLLLERLGITARAQALAARMQGTALENHIAAHRRLTHPKEMGQLFKTVAIVPAGNAMPPGFNRSEG